jgi:single-strand DNA-binding protein
MARGVNKAILLGNLGKDPELRYTQSGSAVANFSIATTRAYKSGEEWKEETEWHNIVVFGKTAENCSNYLSKGSSVFIEGRIQTRKWQDKEGNNRYSTEIVGNDVQFLSGGSRGGQQGGGQQGGGQQGGGQQGGGQQGGGQQGGGQQGGGNDFPSGGGFDPNDDVPF